MSHKMTRRELVLQVFEDGLSDIMYFDREKDTELPKGAIEAAIRAGEVTKEEILALVVKALDDDWHK